MTPNKMNKIYKKNHTKRDFEKPFIDPCKFNGGIIQKSVTIKINCLLYT